MNSDKPRTPPIEPLEYLSGVKIVDIGDLRVARGKSRRPFTTCKHSKLNYDEYERRIWCKDCECDVEGYDAFILLVQQYAKACNDLNDRRDKMAEAESHKIISLAAKVVDTAWRKKSLSPCCPHCESVLLPEDFSKGIKISRNTQMERMRRAKKSNEPA